MSQKKNSIEHQIKDLEKFKSAANGQEFKSTYFESGGFRWCLRIFPNGSNKAKQGNVNFFVGLRSMPPQYTKIATDVTLSLKEANINASFPAEFTETHLTRGWITGTLKTADLQKFSSLTFGAKVEVHDVYGASGNILQSDGDEQKQKTPALSKQSSELILDKQNVHDTRLDGLTRRIEELLLKFDSIENSIDSLTEKQYETDTSLNDVVKEMNAIKKCLGDEYKGAEEIELTEDNQKVQRWLENECKQGQYFRLFVQNGVDNMAICKLLSMDNLEAMGISKLGHRVQIAHQIARLSEKVEHEQ